MNNEQHIIPFGKYKGQPMEILQADHGYCEWLMSQDWFRERYPQFVTVIVNNFNKPDDTPEHNTLQAKFLESEFTEKFKKYLFKNVDPQHYKNFNINSVEFEDRGWDVRLEYEYEEFTVRYIGYERKEYWSNKESSIYIEIKPNVGDDYPSILRQMKANTKNICGNFILLYQSFTASGATEKQVKQIFNNSNYKMISFNDVENEVIISG